MRREVRKMGEELGGEWQWSTTIGEDGAERRCIAVDAVAHPDARFAAVYALRTGAGWWVLNASVVRCEDEWLILEPLCEDPI
jgi:hypothetical protein